MKRYLIGTLIFGGLFLLSAKAEDYKPLDQIINFNSLSPEYRSLLDPTTRANVNAFDADVQRVEGGGALGGSLNEQRHLHVVRAGRFVKIPAGMTAGDVARAWQDAGGDPVVRPPADGSIYWEAHDEHHFVTDAYIGTGFVCAKPGQPGAQYDEIWVRHFLFITADGGLIAGEPPKCE